MTKSAMIYAIQSGKLDVVASSFEEDVIKLGKRLRRSCKNPAGCPGEMYFDGFRTLRYGTPEEKQIAVYVCFRCGYAIMEDV